MTEFNLEVQARETKAGQNKIWCVVLNGKAIGIVEKDRITKEHFAIVLVGPLRATVKSGFAATKEGMAAAVGYVVGVSRASN